MKLTSLDERRLADLKQYVTDRAAPAPRRPRRYVRAAVVMATAAAAVIAGVVATSGGGGGVPAYAVSVGPGGVVTITITDFEDTAQLSAELARLHIPAAVYYLREGDYCDLPMARGVGDVSTHVFLYIYTFVHDGWEIQIQGRPSLMKPGEKLVIGIRALQSEGVAETAGNSPEMTLATGRLTACQYQPEPLLSQLGQFRFANSQL
jgi:hypothetical protein